MNKAIFFDRDGVLIKALIKSNRPFSISNLEDIEYLIKDNYILKRLKDLGYYLLVITNQPDVSRGLVSKKTVTEINNKIVEHYNLDNVYTCFHDDKDNCLCRKPKNGLILRSIKDYDLNIQNCFFIGDRWRDIEAADKSNCKSFFIDYNYDEKKPKNFTFSVKNIVEALNKIITDHEQNN